MVVDRRERLPDRVGGRKRRDSGGGGGGGGGYDADEYESTPAFPIDFPTEDPSAYYGGTCACDSALCLNSTVLQHFDPLVTVCAKRYGDPEANI